MTVDDAVRVLARAGPRAQRLDAAAVLAASMEPHVRELLDAYLGDEDDAVGDLAVRTAVERAPSTVWQRFLPHVQAVLDRRTDARAHERVVARLLNLAASDAWGQVLGAEPRLVDLAARVRRHDIFGPYARAVLAALPRDQAVAAIERYPHEPVQPRAMLPEPRDYLARYLGGERGVWNELVEQALAVIQHDELRAEATAIAFELMKRVRHNADAVRATLVEAGAALEADDSPAGDADLAQFAPLGPLPIALDAFWRVCGSVSFAPPPSQRYHYGECTLEADGIALLALDPLEIAGGRGFSGMLDEHARAVAASHRDIVGPLWTTLSRDFLHKQDISGGPPYAVELPPRTPADEMDPRVYHARHRLRFVEYIRHSFRWGGFGMLEIAHRPVEHIALNDRIAFRRVAGDWGEATDRLLARLRANLVDF